MIVHFGHPAILSKNEVEEIQNVIRLGGKYILFEFEPNDRRTERNRINIYATVSEKGDKERCNIIIGATAMALHALYDDFCIEEIHHMKFLGEYGLVRAFLLEDILKYFSTGN